MFKIAEPSLQKSGDMLRSKKFAVTSLVACGALLALSCFDAPSVHAASPVVTTPIAAADYDELAGTGRGVTGNNVATGSADKSEWVVYDYQQLANIGFSRVVPALVAGGVGSAVIRAAIGGVRLTQGMIFGSFH